MAKIISPFVGSAKGKLGGAVYYTRTGGTFARQRVATVANPKTDAQLVTRVILSTASKAYRFFQPLSDHAFQDMSGKSRNHEAFMHLNAAILRAGIAEPSDDPDAPIDFGYNMKNFDKTIANAYVIADGSLTSAVLEEGELHPAEGQDPAVKGIALVIPSSADTLTYREVINALGLQSGAQITFVDTVTPYAEVTMEKLVYGRLILAPYDGNLDQELFDSDGAVNNPNQRNYGLENFDFRAVKVNGQWTIVFLSKDSQSGDSLEPNRSGGGTVIFSQNEGGRWLRSRAVISQRTYGMSRNYDMPVAVASYRSGSTSSLYLNQAD